MIDLGWWVSAFLMMAGVIGLVVLWLDVFTAVGYKARKIFSRFDIPATGSSEFLHTVARTAGQSIQRGGNIRVLHNGDAFLEAFLKEAQAAQYTITATSYIWFDGEMNQKILDVFEERVRAGVQVYVLLDAHGSKEYWKNVRTKLEAVGVKVALFRPLRFGNIFRFYRRSHRRAFVVDGRVGYTGGIAVEDQWLGNADAPDRWRDDMFEVTGALAHTVQSAFAGLWVSATGEVLVGDRFYAVGEREVSGDTQFVGLVSSPSFDMPPLDKFWWLSIMGARKRIWITTPFVTAYKSLRLALEQQAQRGVDVRILLPGDLFDSHRVRYAGHAHYDSLLRAGVKLYEYQPAMMHTKTFVVDDSWAVVGSANFDVRSVRINEEMILGICSAELTQTLSDDFERDCSVSEEIILSAWKERPLWFRVRETVYRLFEEQF